MGKVTVDISMSLDGFVTEPDPGRENPLGDDPGRLHDWMFDEKTAETLITVEAVESAFDLEALRPIDRTEVRRGEAACVRCRSGALVAIDESLVTPVQDALDEQYDPKYGGFGYGPNPRECIDRVISFDQSILGNHDQGALYDPEGFSSGAERAIFWTREQLEHPNGDPLQTALLPFPPMTRSPLASS